MKKYVSKRKFTSEFKTLFNIDVTVEPTDIYPDNICVSHAAVFYRCRSAIQNNKPFSTDMLPVAFTSHSASCQICNKVEADQISEEKNYKHAPGRGKRCSTFVEPNSVPDQKKQKYENPLITAYHSISLEERQRYLDEFINHLTIDEKSQVIKTIFTNEQQNISETIDSIQMHYNSVYRLNNLDIKKYLLSEHNQLLLTTLIVLTNSDVDKDYFRLSIIIECIYKLKNNNFMGPTSTLQNLSILSLTKSKSAVDICGSSTAGGKYSALCKFLKNVPSTPTEGPEGEAVYVFDNEQIIGKTWNIKPNNKVKCSIVTTVVAAQLSKDISFQQKQQFHPASWLTKEEVTKVVDKVINEKEDIFNQYKSVHLQQFKLFISAAIEQILEEKTRENDIVQELVTKHKQSRELKTCPECKNLLPKSKRKCPDCKISLTRLQDPQNKNDNDDNTEQIEVTPMKLKRKKTASDQENKEPFRFDHVENHHPDEPVQVFVLDPVFVNPNSVDSLKMVLRHIGKTAGVKRYGGEEREWVVVCCDGLPYTIVYRMIVEFFTCVICSQGFLGEAAFANHKKEHPEIKDVQFIREFDWILLKTGDGHYEMNMMKSFIELNWDVCMRVLVNRMGWTSEAAMKAAKMCYDNHKTWQLLLTFHLGTLQELLVPYISKCSIANQNFEPKEGTQNVGETPSANGFLRFLKSKESNPTYMHMFEMVSKYSQAIINFRMGIRRNNSLLVQSAKFMSKGLFHGRSHPRYQQIEMLDTVQRMLMPEQLRNHLDNHESMSKSGDVSKGQGYDFVLEEYNRDIKSWIRRGVATDEMWLSVCRNFEHLNDLRLKLQMELKLTGREVTTRKVNLDDAILDWRVCLREKEYLLKDRLLHESMDGQILHEGLVKFTAEANRKRNYRLLDFFLDIDGPEDPSLKHPVFVTREEAEYNLSFENQTIAVIDQVIYDTLDTVADECVKRTYQDKFRKEILRKRKSVHINFYREIMEMINEQNEPSSENDESEDAEQQDLGEES